MVVSNKHEEKKSIQIVLYINNIKEYNNHYTITPQSECVLLYLSTPHGSSWTNFGWHHFLSQSPGSYNHVNRYIKRWKCRSAACVDVFLASLFWLSQSRPPRWPSQGHAWSYYNYLLHPLTRSTKTRSYFLYPSTVYTFDYATVVKLLRRNLRGAAVI